MPADHELTNVDVALYVLFQLGGVNKKIHTEEIAWQAFSLSRERFSWVLKKYREMGFPDKTAVRYALESAKKLKLVSGRAGRDRSGSESEGWKYTPEGVAWIDKNEKRIRLLLDSETPFSPLVPRIEAERFIKKIKMTNIYASYKNDSKLENVSIYELADFLQCSADSPKDVMRQKFLNVQTSAALIKDIEINNFLKACKFKFPDFLIEPAEK